MIKSLFTDWVIVSHVTGFAHVGGGANPISDMRVGDAKIGIGKIGKVGFLIKMARNDLKIVIFLIFSDCPPDFFRFYKIGITKSEKIGGNYWKNYDF